MSKLTIRRDVPGDTIFGTTSFLAPRGLFVVLNPANPDELIKANDVLRAYNLERDIVTEQPLSDIVFNNEIQSPVVLGNEITARRARFLEVEGGDHLVLSGTGALTDAVAANTELEFYQGQLRIAQEGNSVAGRVVSKIDAEEEGNTFRLLVELSN